MEAAGNPWNLEVEPGLSPFVSQKATLSSIHCSLMLAKCNAYKAWQKAVPTELAVLQAQAFISSSVNEGILGATTLPRWKGCS